MTAPVCETIEHEKDKLFVTDAELIRRIGVPAKIARVALRLLDTKPGGFPKKQKLWGDRRYWPAVVGYFDHHYGFSEKRVDPSSGRER
jgi:hypothetical protein